MAAIDYLGAIAAKLRRDIVTSQLDVSLVCKIVHDADNNVDENGNEISNEKQKKKQVQLHVTIFIAIKV